MPFRTVVINTHSKLEYSLNYLVFKTPENVKRILMDEIHTLIIQSTEISLTTALISEMSKRKIKVIFCDEKRNPESELIPLSGSHNSSIRIHEQITWSKEKKEAIWAEIVRSKILGEAAHLRSIGLEAKSNMLLDYSKEILPGDATNREGHSAKVYFNCVFFDGFSREKDCKINDYLNYGYTLILSQFNRSICAAGYILQLGIHHKGDLNPFNFSCDLMEPFRVFVDIKAKTIKENDDFKTLLQSLLTEEIVIDNKKQTFVNAINIYCLSIFNALDSGDIKAIRFPQYV